MKAELAAWSLVELLVALAVISVFLIGVFTAFIQILRASDRSERMVEAHQNARAAVETIAYYIKQARVEPRMATPCFLGINLPTFLGDRIDNDRDGRVDEEQPDGLDNDNDWLAQRDDRHARIGDFVERARFVSARPDLGDEHVDEDCVFHRDRLSLTLFPDPALPGSQAIVTSFSIGAWEGEQNVLLQQIARDGGTGRHEIAPLAYNVLSVNFLYWDANQPQPYWVEQWNSALVQPQWGRGFQLPAAVCISVTVYSGQIPLSQLGPNQTVETVTASTVVNIESVIHDPRYEMVRANQ